MSIPKDILGQFNDEIILAGYRGSISHGTYRPNTDETSIDDKDAMIIVIPNIKYYFGLKEWGSRGTKEIKRGEWDIVVYEIRKFINLLAKGNPNVLFMLWLDENMYLKRTTVGQRIINNRDMFSSKAVYHSFSGYSYSQLKRISSDEKCIDNLQKILNTIDEEISKR